MPKKIAQKKTDQDVVETFTCQEDTPDHHHQVIINTRSFDFESNVNEFLTCFLQMEIASG